MRAVVLLCAALALCAPQRAAAAPAEPPNQSLVFFNARIALRENRAADALKLWLMRNSLANRGEPGLHDPDFRSVVWAALGRQGLCQDGLREDGDGAGLWPLGLHNWLLHAMSKGPPPGELAPWEAFTVARQQRFVSLHDVLSAEELRSVEFFRTGCLRPYSTRLGLGGQVAMDLQDRLTVGVYLRQLLEEAKQTLVKEKVESLALIETRIFDLDLALAELQARRARRDAREEAHRARSAGVSKAGAAELRAQLGRFPEDSPQAAFLRQSLTWRPGEWLLLSKPRRLFLFRQALPLAQDPAAARRLMVGMIDALIDRGEGDELASWVGFLDAADSPELRELLTRGDRGARLLQLEPETGFRERAVVALHRGVQLMEAGELQQSLRSFAFALRHSDESREALATAGLARRWLSYALSRYEATDEVIATLRALVPRQEYNTVIEDLVWRAAMRADARSFERIVETVRRGSSFDARIDRLRPLAEGKAGELATRLRRELADEPYSVLRFVRLFVERVEAEDPDVRTAQVPTIKLVLQILAPVAANADGKNNAHARVAGELVGRLHALLEGLRQLDDTGPGRAHGLGLRSETFAGSIRLAPVDELPWPFVAPEPDPPSPFAQLLLVPVEWRDARGERVFGWRITE